MAVSIDADKDGTAAAHSSALGTGAGDVSRVANPWPTSVNGRLGIGVIALAACAALGWLFDVPVLTTFVPGRPTMSIVTAIGLIIAAVALIQVRLRKRALRLAAVQLFLGALIVGAYTMGAPLSSWPWLWPSRVTGIGLTLSGVSACLLACGRRWQGQAVAFLTLLLVTLVGMGHFFPTADLYRYLPGSGVAIPTLLAFLLLSIGQLMAFTDTGIAAALTARSLAGKASLRLILGGLIVPLLLCLFVVGQHRQGSIDAETAIMIVSWGAMALLGSTLWGLAIAVDRAEQARRLAEDQHNSLRRMLVAALTHDVRSPLQNASLAAAMLHGACKEDRAEATLARLERSHRRIDRLLQNLLDSLSLDGGQQLVLRPSSFDLLALAREVSDEHEARLRARVQILGEPVQGVWDHGSLFRVLENLLLNADKYGRAGGSIVCTVKGGDDRVRLTVRNEGEPIPADEWERIFQPFSRGRSAVRSSRAGWGVGLAYARAVATLHGGTLVVESSNNEGTTFALALPIDSGKFLERAPDHLYEAPE